MSNNIPQTPEHISLVVEQLTDELGATVPRSSIEDIVRTASQDLEGQVLPSSLEEMLHRLAHYRLTRTSPVRPAPSRRSAWH
jgi:hypothetical protein